MANITNFTTALLDKQGRIYHQDDNGDIWYPYIYEYRYEDKAYSLNLWARNVEEAEKVKESLKASIKLLGEIIEEIPA